MSINVPYDSETIVKQQISKPSPIDAALNILGGRLDEIGKMIAELNTKLTPVRNGLDSPASALEDSAVEGSSMISCRLREIDLTLINFRRTLQNIYHDIEL